jgi:hypothetical protein
MDAIRILRTPRALGVAILGTLALSACDEDSIMRQGIDSLGADFVEAYNQDPLDDPLDASALTLTLTPLDEPFDI